jgi:hypothetical protein
VRRVTGVGGRHSRSARRAGTCPRPEQLPYALAADANASVEAQLKEMTQAGFEETATALSMTEPLEGVGDAAYQKPNGIMGLPGTTILVFGGGRGVTVSIAADGDAADQLAAAIDIAEAALAAQRPSVTGRSSVRRSPSAPPSVVDVRLRGDSGAWPCAGIHSPPLGAAPSQVGAPVMGLRRTADGSPAPARLAHSASGLPPRRATGMPNSTSTRSGPNS